MSHVSDFYSLLKQSIIDRGISDAGKRDEVYAQARRAMVGQLWAYKPALPRDDIDRRIKDFDATVERIEIEVAAVFAEEDEALPADDYGEALATWDNILAGDDSDEHDGNGYDALDDQTYYGKRPYHPLPPREDGEDGYAPSSSQAAATSLGYEPAPAPPADDDDGVENEAPRRRFGDRWSPDPGIRGHERGQPAARLLRQWPALSEQDKVRFLIGAIGGLSLVLIGFIVYALMPGGDTGVTLPIDANQQVSDAATAARNATAALDVERSFVVFDGHDPTIFQTSPDNPVRLDSDSQGSFTRVSSSTDSTGTKVTIGPGLAAQFAGRNIRVIISARASKDRGAANMRFAYQSGLAISHWQTANLSADYSDVALLWRVPTQRTSSNGADYLIIEPGIPGDATGADIRSIKIDLLTNSK
jgi:hypothetical protein